MANPQVNYSGSSIVCNDIIYGVTAPIGATQVSGYPSLPEGKYSTRAINFNSATTDTAVTINLPVGTTLYRLDQIAISNASHTLTTATIGVFTAAGGTGTTLLADSAVTVATATVGGANSAQVLTGVATVNTNSATLYIRIGTPEGAAATADVILTLAYL